MLSYSARSRALHSLRNSTDTPRHLLVSIQRQSKHPARVSGRQQQMGSIGVLGQQHSQQQLVARHRSMMAQRVVCSATALQPESVAQAKAPKLSEIPMQAVINPQGYVAPEIVPGTSAAVFSVFDEQQKLQYIGFSKNLSCSLRTVLGRRPDKTWYYKAAQLPELDQDLMLAIRQAWFDECGAPPPGNKLALERKAWQSAVDAGAISARAKPAAAAEKAKELQAQLRARGCVEDFTPDPDLLQEGQVNFLQHSVNQQQQQEAAASKAAAAATSRKPVRTATAIVDGQAKQFEVEYTSKFPTKGGYLVDVKLSFDHMVTKHRIIVGRSYYEPYGIPVEAPIEAALALMLHRKMSRHSEGMLASAEFPVNYFTISEMEQWFDEEFAASFLHTTGKHLQDGQDFFWRMNKIHDYGAKLEDHTNLGSAMSGIGTGYGM
eukprot:GHRR01004483.1.p1 GENE.GHRR01004483.1~~GHRR01004483.1.p1  ORF type:complete len:434 (+),score=139.37 GHRR01004483.1:216-1517(+)